MKRGMSFIRKPGPPGIQAWMRQAAGRTCRPDKKAGGSPPYFPLAHFTAFVSRVLNAG